MRLIFLAALSVGCVTSGQVREARVAQVDCIDRRIAELRASTALGEDAYRASVNAADCWLVARSHATERDITADIAACRAWSTRAERLEEDAKVADRRAAETGAACSALAANADALQEKREDQAAAADAALIGMQIAGRARQDMAATQASAPRPISCSSSQVGAQTYTTCQ